MSSRLEWLVMVPTYLILSVVDQITWAEGERQQLEHLKESLQEAA